MSAGCCSKVSSFSWFHAFKHFPWLSESRLCASSPLGPRCPWPGAGVHTGRGCHGGRPPPPPLRLASGPALSETVTQALASFSLFPSFPFYLTEPFKHLLSACCVPGTALGTGNRTEHTGESCRPSSGFCSGVQDGNKQR